ncbi:hypothetical protein V8G54_009370, partial [Vigna mungo]
WTFPFCPRTFDTHSSIVIFINFQFPTILYSIRLYSLCKIFFFREVRPTSHLYCSILLGIEKTPKSPYLSLSSSMSSLSTTLFKVLYSQSLSDKPLGSATYTWLVGSNISNSTSSPWLDNTSSSDPFQLLTSTSTSL